MTNRVQSTVTSSTALTVTQLTVHIRTYLEQGFPEVWVQGEVSNLSTPSSGHVYFTLKDERSQIRAVLFRRSALLLRFALENGLDVLVRGRISVYEPRGDYQILVEWVEPQGVGALQLAYEQLKQKLEKEGLFDEFRKQPLPFLPKTVGVITSPTGAAIRDILTVLHRRCPIIRVRVYPVSVQGEGAAEQIAEAIQRCDQDGDVEVMIVGRGGGSWEDLWCFNEEMVIRAIAKCRTPVVSAVGHEVDFTLADFAADYRAPTPSAAAEAVAPVLVDLQNGLWVFRDRMRQAIQSQLSQLRQRLFAVDRALPRPQSILQMRCQRIDELTTRLIHEIRRKHSECRPTVLALMSMLMQRSPQKRIDRAFMVIQHCSVGLCQAMSHSLSQRRHRFQRIAVALDTLNPLSMLARGYSVIERETTREIVRSRTQVQCGERVRAIVSDGSLSCFIEQIDPSTQP